jgi:hypothetical protein
MPYADPEKEKECQRRYREKHLDKLLAYHREYHHAHKETISQKTKEYGRRNRKRLNAYRLEYRNANLTKCRQWENKSQRAQRENLGDTYVKQILTMDSPLVAADIPQPLVEAKRQHLKIKRMKK